VLKLAYVRARELASWMDDGDVLQSMHAGDVRLPILTNPDSVEVGATLSICNRSSSPRRHRGMSAPLGDGLPQDLQSACMHTRARDGEEAAARGADEGEDGGEHIWARWRCCSCPGASHW
jgi:hypothetical protein